MTGVISAVVALIAGLVGTVILLGGRNRRLRRAKDQAEVNAQSAVKRVEQTVDLQVKQQTIQEKAGEKKKNLDENSDSDLVDLANGLFSD